MTDMPDVPDVPHVGQHGGFVHHPPTLADRREVGGQGHGRGQQAHVGTRGQAQAHTTRRRPAQ